MASRYHDEGCDLAPSCLNCPFPRCRYDDTTIGPRRGRKPGPSAGRHAEMVHLRREEGLSITELAARFDVSKRTVHRILATGREAE